MERDNFKRDILWVLQFIPVSLKLGKDEKEEVWDGRTKGPPRKDKFPELDDVLAMIKKALE